MQRKQVCTLSATRRIHELCSAPTTIEPRRQFIDLYHRKFGTLLVTESTKRIAAQTELRIREGHDSKTSIQSTPRQVRLGPALTTVHERC